MAGDIKVSTDELWPGARWDQENMTSVTSSVVAQYQAIMEDKVMETFSFKLKHLL